MNNLVLLSSNSFAEKPPQGKARADIRKDLLSVLNNPEAGVSSLSNEELAECITDGYVTQFSISIPIGTDTDGKTLYQFKAQNLFGVDIDNGNPNAAIETPESYLNKLHEYGIEASIVYYSYSHTDKKPKFRVLVPCDEIVTKDKERSDIINGLINLSKQADTSCKDGNRYFFGTNKEIDESLCDFNAANSKQVLLSLPLPENYNYSTEWGAAGAAGRTKSSAGSCKWGEPIEVGERNSVLSARAFALLKSNYPDQQRAWNEYTKSVAACVEPLPESEVNEIWTNALRAFNSKVVNNPNIHLIPRAEYRSNKNKESYFPKDWSDVGQSKVFARVYRDKLLYTPEWGFLYFDGQIYQKKSKEYAQHLAQELTDLQLEEVESKRTQLNQELEELKNLNDSDMAEAKEKRIERELKELNKVQHKIESMRNGSHIKATVEFSKARLTIDKEKLDSNPWELNTPAGIIDLRTGEMRERTSQDLLTKITAVSPSNKGKDEWNKFTESITDWSCPKGQEHIYKDQDSKERSKELCEYLQAVTGLSLIGEIVVEGLFLHYGATGANGKSTLFSVLLHSIGDYGVTIDVNDFLLNKINNPFSSAALDGVRFAECNEPPFNVPIDGAATKRFTSRDTIPAQRKYMDAYNFKPTHTTHMTSNLLPKWNFKDKGVERRLFPIPYNAHFEGDKCDPLLEQKLIKNCSEAALQWMIEGAVKFYKAGCTLEPFTPDFIKSLKKDWIEENNSVKTFIDECCVIDRANPNCMIKTKTFHDTLQKYLRQNYLPYMNARQIKDEMELLGFEWKKTGHNRERYYIGIDVDNMP